MAKKGSFSKVYDKNGDYVDVEAARFDGTRTFQMQGDVSATQTWNGDSASALTLNTSIGVKKVTTDKINDKAVQTGQIDDGAVGLTQIATNAMNGTVQDNDSKLATHAAVKTYVDAQISGQGTYLGKHTVAEINAMVTDNLHNGDRVMTSDSGTINLGPGGVGFDVEAGEDLILYKSGSTVQWDSMDGNFKTKQTAVSDPTASGTGLTFIDSASQDENGEMTLSKKTVQDGTTSQKGVVQLEDSHSSTSTTKAATPNSVKEAYDLASTANSGLANKQDKPSSATENNIAVFNGSKSTKDSGKSFLPSTSTWDGTSDDKVPTAKAVQARLDNKGDADKVVAIADSTFRRQGEPGDGWFKIASTAFTKINTNAIGFFDVFYGQLATSVGTMSVKFNVRVDGSGTTPSIKGVEVIKVSGLTTNPMCVVVRGLSGNVTVELWGYLPSGNISMAVVARSVTKASADFPLVISKNAWTFYSGSGNSTSKPVADAGNNVQVQDASEIVIQKNIASPTNNNLVAMDANGLVKDSGKKAADFEQVANKVTSIRAAGSATDTAYPSEKAVATALAGKQDDFLEVQTTWVQATIGTETNRYRKIGSVTLGAWYRATAIFVCNFDDGRPGGILEIALRRESGSAGEPTHASVSLFTTTQHGGNIDATKYNIGYEMVDGTCNLYFKATSTQGQVCRCIYSKNFTVATASVSTAPTAYTNIPIYTVAQSQFETATGSSSVPIYVDKNGVLTACTDDFEHTTNKVSSWQSTPDNTHYPSEKLVKDGLNAKADANKVVAIADAVVSRMGTTGWFKVAERAYNQLSSTAGGTWAVTIISASKNITCHYTIDLNIRAQTSGTNAAVRIFSSSPLGLSASDNYDNFRCVLNGTSGSLTIELWYYAGGAHESMMLSELATGVYNGTSTKFGWTYYKISSSAAGSETAPTGNVVKDIDFVYAQKPVANATAGNFAGLDANGLLTDSGKKSADFATAAQGTKADSAIQGVKVNNTTLTPDANKVVTVPLATTSADGAMSAADKTKLNKAVTKKTGIAYKGTAGGDVFKIAEKSYSRTGSHSEQFVFHVSYSKHSTNAATSELNVLLKVSKDSDSEVTVFRNTVTSKQGFGALDWKFKASVDDTNGLFTLYAVRTAGQYTTVEATCIAANTERYNLIDNVVVFENTTAELPETVFTETTLFSATSSASSGTAPVKVDAYGALSAVPIDSTPDASHADNLISSKGVADALSGITSNVQADWDVTSSTSDAFIKHKPQYKYYSTTSTYAKICSFPLDASGENVSGYGIDILYRRYLGEVHGRLLYKKTFKFYCEYTGDISYTNQSYSFYYVVNSNKMDVYAKRNGYTTLNVAPLTNIPKDQVDFTDFGTEVSSLPEGATEITPVWVASSASSSGTAPVKVGSYGQLTAVPMDSTPTASSTNLMTSGDIKTALDLKVDESDVQDTYSSTSEDPISGKGVADALVSTGSGYVHVRGPASNMATVFKFSISSSYTTTGIAEVWCSSGAHYHLQFTVGANAETVSFDGTYAERSNYVSVAYKYDSTAKELTVAVNQLQYYTVISKKVVSIKANSGTVDVAYEYVNGAIDNTYTTYYCARRAFIRNNNSNVGSTSVPAYVSATGQLAECTDDFVHDGDVAQTYSSSSTAPISGHGVKAAVDNLSNTQIPIGLKYDMVLANETSTTPTLCYEISNIGLTSNYSAATAELVVYQYAALGTSYTNIPSYKVVVHWDRASAICIVEGLNPTGTWTAVVENSTTPSSTDVTTLKLYFKPAQYRTYRMSVVSCKLRGASRESYITDGTIVVKKVTQEIPTASTLVIVGTTTVKTLICDKNVTSTYSATGTDPVNGTAVASAISGKQDSLPTIGTASDTYAINISGFSNRMRGATVAGATSGTGYYKLAKFKFDNFPRTYEGALLSIITRSGNQSIEGLISVSFSEWTTADEAGDIIGNVAILGMRGTELPTSMYDMYFIKTASKEYYLYAHIKKTSVIVTVNILNVDAGVNPADVLLVPEYVGSELPTNLKNLKLPYRKMVYGTVVNGAVGSSSIPVHIDANGKATACTDDFARDSEVVTSVQKETVSSVTKLTYTKNGSKTDVLTFMDDTDAHSLWTNAKANAS